MSRKDAIFDREGPSQLGGIHMGAMVSRPSIPILQVEERQHCPTAGA
jgi:hypothetical protein